MLYGVLATGTPTSILKSFCEETSCLSKYHIKFLKTLGETAKVIAIFKETTSNKFLQAASALGGVCITILDPRTDSKVD